MSQPNDHIAGLATRARHDLNAATTRRPVPVLPGRSLRRGAPAPAVVGRRRVRSPILVAAAVAVFVLGILIGIGSVGDRGSLSRNVVSTVDADNRPSAVATDGATVWVADTGSGRVLAYNARDLSLRWAVTVGPHPVGLAYGFGALWVVDGGDRQLRELAPGDGHLLGHANTSLDPIAVTTLDRVWVLAAGNNTVDGYNPQNLTQDRSGRGLASPTSFAAGSGALWATTRDGLLRVLSTGSDAVVVDAGGPVSLVASDGQLLWLTSPSGELRAFDPAIGQVLARAALPGTATAIAASRAGVAVATDDGTVSFVTAPGDAVRVVAHTGAALTSLAITGNQILGTSPTTALLYRMEIPS
jgi:hypothetical protein